MRALRADDVVAKAIADAHTTALSEAMEYLAAHAGYTRIHNPHTGEKDLVRLPAWRRSPISTRPPAAGTRTCTRMSSCPTGRPAPTGGWCRSMARRSITKPARPGSSIKPPCAANSTPPWASNGHRRPLHRDGGAGRGRPRHHHRVVATLHPAARVGRPQPRPSLTPTPVLGTTRDRAEGHPTGQTRGTRLGATAGSVARRCARPAPRPRTLRRGTRGATKAAIRSFGRTWATELITRGIRVNTVIPGPIETPGLTGLAPAGQGRQLLDGEAAKVPMGRVGRPEELAAAVLFLAPTKAASSPAPSSSSTADRPTSKCHRRSRPHRNNAPPLFTERMLFPLLQILELPNPVSLSVPFDGAFLHAGKHEQRV